jgi:hypothetical protein
MDVSLADPKPGDFEDKVVLKCNFNFEGPEILETYSTGFISVPALPFPITFIELLGLFRLSVFGEASYSSKSLFRKSSEFFLALKSLEPFVLFYFFSCY